MIRNLHTGPFQPVLEDALVRHLALQPRADRLTRRLLVAPNHLLARHLALLLARRLGGWVGIEIATLGGLVKRIAEPVLGDRGALHLAPLGQELIARRVALEAVHDGEYFHPLRESSGFPFALLETFRDLGESRITPEHLRAMAKSGRLPAATAGKCGELAALYGDYLGRLEDRGLVDDAGRLALAVPAADLSPFLRSCGEVILYGIYDLNPLQRTLVTALLGSRAARVFFPYGHDAEFDFAAPTLEWFRGLGFTPVGDPDAAAASPTRGPESTTVLVAHSEQQEIREAFRSWFFGKTGESESIGILVPRSEDYHEAMDACAGAAGVHIARSGHPREAGDPAAAAALRLLDLKTGVEARSARRALRRREVMAFASLAPRHDDAAAPGEWDRLSIRLRIRGDDDWEKRLDACVEQARRRLAEPRGDDPVRDRARASRELIVAGSLREFIETLREALDAIPSRGAWSEVAAALERSLARLRVIRQPEDVLAGALDEITTFDRAGGATHLAEFTAFLERALRSSRTASRDAAETAAAWTADLLNARGVPADTIVIAGLTEGSFPRRPRQDPLLLDHERRRMNALLEERNPGAGGGNEGTFALPLKLERAREEELLFLLAVGSARHDLVLTFSHTDPVTSRERTPSPFLLEPHRALPATPLTRRLRPAGLPLTDPGDALDEREFELGWLARGRSSREALFARRPALAGPVRRAEERWQWGTLSPRSGVFESPRALEALDALRARRGSALSASRLQDYAKCPQLYFLKNVLGLDVDDDPELAFSLPPMARGELYHHVLKELIENARAKGVLPWRPQHLETYLALLDEAIDHRCSAFAATAAAGPALFWSDARRELRADLRRFIVEETAAGSTWIPAYVELSFGEEAPLVVTLAGDGVETRVPLRGRIDRIDLRGDAASRDLTARIVDYKTGKRTMSAKNPLGEGRELQLPLYSRAAEALLQASHPGLRVEEALYYHVCQRRRFGKTILDAAVDRALESDLARIAGVLLAGIETGLYFPAPLEREQFCARCEMQPVCGPGMPALAELKESDPRARALAGIRAGDAGEETSE